jgi:hypothetical protein
MRERLEKMGVGFDEAVFFIEPLITSFFTGGAFSLTGNPFLRFPLV